MKGRVMRGITSMMLAAAVLLTGVLVMLPTRALAGKNFYTDTTTFNTGDAVKYVTSPIVLDHETVYYVTRNTTIINRNTDPLINADSALQVDGTTVLYIEKGVTLTVKAYDPYENTPGLTISGVLGGGAGIYVVEGATLIITGGGSLVARGGKGYYPTRAFDGSPATQDRGGMGGVGGTGGGGAGAGIGGIGGMGGAGGLGGWGGTKENHKGSAGSNGSDGEPGYACGNIYILGNTYVDAKGGKGVTNRAGWTGYYGRYAEHTDRVSVGGGGGGGAGAAGHSAADIGSGGSGGGGGGGGAGGTFHIRGGILGGNDGAIATSTSTGYQGGSGGDSQPYDDKNTKKVVKGGKGGLSSAKVTNITPSTTAPDSVVYRISLSNTENHLSSSNVYLNNLVLGQSVPQKASVITPMGYRLSGYHQWSNDTQIIDRNGEWIPGLYVDSSGRWRLPRENITLIGKKEPIEYKLSYSLDAGGTLGAGTPTTARYGEAVSIPAPISTDANSAFMGWRVSSGGNFDTAECSVDGGATWQRVTSHSMRIHNEDNPVLFKSLTAMEGRTVSLSAMWTDIIPVTDIQLLNTTPVTNKSIRLRGSVSPAYATYQTIVWSVKDPKSTGAVIDPATGLFSAVTPGELVLTATVVNGLAQGSNFTKDFNARVYGELQTGDCLVTVVNGTGSGIYPTMSVVQIIADAPPEGKRFKEWVGNAPIFSPQKSTNSFLVQSSNVTVTATYEDIPPSYVETPEITPGGGTLSANTQVSITCATPGADIHYTTDGSEPTRSSRKYNAPFFVSQTMTVKAKAFRDDIADSATKTASFVVMTHTVRFAAPPRIFPVGGVYYSPRSVRLSCSTVGAEIRYTTNGSTPTETSTLYQGPITVAADTVIRANSFADGMLSGLPVKAEYFIREPAAVVEMPTFTPDGGTYKIAQDVTITCDTLGAEIRYTTDGSDPLSVSPAYTAPIHIAATATLKARAFKDGMTASDINEATYAINPDPDPDVPETGERAVPEVWLTIALAALAGLALSIIAYRRRVRAGEKA